MKKTNKEYMTSNIVKIVSVIATVFCISSLLFTASCSDDTFLLGYNKELEEIHQSIFETDSLVRRIIMDFDSLAKRKEY